MAKRDNKAERTAKVGVTKAPIDSKLADPASEIQAGHRLCLDSLKGAISQAKVIVLSLIEAKKLVKHGRWLAWVDANCKFAPRNDPQGIAESGQAQPISNGAARSRTTATGTEQLIGDKTNAARTCHHGLSPTVT